MKKEKWFKDGIKFECQNCGTGCKNHSNIKACVYLNGDDIKNISEFLKNNKCPIYKARPVQCVSWPFREINLIKTNWNNNIKPICKGIGKGNF